jgi:3-oxoacyl-[acyl-carrier-protein] synthase I
MMQPIQLTDYTAHSALGLGLQAHRDALIKQHSALRHCDFKGASLDTYIGRIPELDHVSLPDGYHQYDSRCNRLAYSTLQADSLLDSIEQAKTRYGKKRIGLLVGTTASGFTQTERAYRHLTPSGDLPENFDYINAAHPYASCRFLRDYLDLQGHAYVLATACSSSAKIFIHAQQLISQSICDAVLVVGIDALCLNVLYGFNALGVLSHLPCQPFGQDRKGLSLGEASAMFLLEKPRDGKLALLGAGESTDGYHMSSPHPEGQGAILSMKQALATAGLEAHDIDYINCHGTASELNDAAESKAIEAVFGDKPLCSSTKGLTGHTLGAAGALEALLSCLAIDKQMAWGTSNTLVKDPKLNANIALSNITTPINVALSNSFGFGGNNASLIFGGLS